MEKGILFKDKLENNTKAFRNPSIVSKLIEFLEVDEIGSNFEMQVFDPHGFAESDYFESIGTFILCSLL